MIFDDAFKKVVSLEGGFVDHPSDPGGRTKWGISQRAFPDVDIAAMSIDECKLLYKKRYWDMVQADKLPDAVRYSVFDAAVNSGVRQAVKWLQRAVNVGDDGVLGAVTLAAVQGTDGGKLAAKFNGERLDFMTNLPTWGVFGKGWARRIAANLMEV